jgi:hypothetical protein
MAIVLHHKSIRSRPVRPIFGLLSNFRTRYIQCGPRGLSVSRTGPLLAARPSWSSGNEFTTRFVDRGQQPTALAIMLGVHFLQRWFSLYGPGMKEAFYERTCGSLN